MDQSTRYRLMRDNGLTTAYLARRFGKHVRSVRRVIQGELRRAKWAEECRRLIAERVEESTYEELWGRAQEGGK